MGFHPDAESFQSRSPDLVETRRAMWLWAEPIIIDRGIEIYSRLVDDAGTVALARRHCRLWRNILLDQPCAVAPSRAETVRAAEALGLPAETADDADDVILDELVDVVMGRYRSSRNDMKAFSRVLMAANSCLATARAS